MSLIPSSMSGDHRTTTEETSINPPHNILKGFPYACSCGGEVNVAFVQDHISNGQLCFVCEYIGDGGDHLEKMFDEAVREEIQWTQKQIVDHEDRLSRVERNIPPELNIDLSREITKIYGMVKSLRAVYEKCTNTPQEGISRIREAATRFTHSGRFSCALSVIIGVLVGYMGHRWGFEIMTGQST